MLISGQLGLLARPTADGVEIVRPDGSVVRHSPQHEVARLFGRASDVIERRDDDVPAALRILAAERSRDLAVRRLIMLFDAEEDGDIAERAASRLETLLDTDRSLDDYLEGEFSSAPLPPDLAQERCTALASNKPKLSTLLSLIFQHQPAIRRNRRAFDDAMVATGLWPMTAAPLLEQVIAAGLFRRLLYGSKRQALSLLATFPVKENWMRDAVDAWGRHLDEAWTETGAGSVAPPARPVRFGRPNAVSQQFEMARRMLASFLTSVTPSAIVSAPRAYAGGGAPVDVPPSRLPVDRAQVLSGGGAPVVTMQALLEAGAQFGHQTHRWNPKMKPYIFGDRNGVHILDLTQTVPLFARALDYVASSVAAGGKVLFVGTKRQAQEPIADAARRSRQHYVNHRWLGGMLVNWKTISNSIRRMKALEEQLSGDLHGLTKKEVLRLTRERDKLELSLGGIRDMGGVPDVMFVIDAKKEEVAIKEANMLGIPVVAILDSNVSPDGIAFPVPANDDAARAIRLYCEAIAIAATRRGEEPDSERERQVGELEPPASSVAEHDLSPEPEPEAEAEAGPADEVAPQPEDDADPSRSRHWSLWHERD